MFGIIMGFCVCGKIFIDEKTLRLGEERSLYEG